MLEIKLEDFVGFRILTSKEHNSVKVCLRLLLLINMSLKRLIKKHLLGKDFTKRMMFGNVKVLSAYQ